MNNKFKYFLVFYIGAAFTFSNAFGKLAQAPFKSRDSIEVTSLYNTTNNRHNYGDTPFYLSDDEKFLFIITGKGDVDNNTYNFQLLQFDIESIKKYLNKDAGDQPTPRQLLSINYNQSDDMLPNLGRGAIQNIHLDSSRNRLFYMAPDSNGIFQIFYLSIEDRKITQVTNSNSHVYDYIFNYKTHTIIYQVFGNVVSKSDCDKKYYRAGTKLKGYLTCLRNGKSIYDDAYGLPSHKGSSVHLLRLDGTGASMPVLSNIDSLNILSRLIFSPELDKAIVPFEVKFNIVDGDIVQAGNMPAGIESEFAKRVYRSNTSSHEYTMTLYVIINLNNNALDRLSIYTLSDTSANPNIYWIDNNKIVFKGEFVDDDGTRSVSDPDISSPSELSFVYNAIEKKFEKKFGNILKDTRHMSLNEVNKNKKLDENLTKMLCKKTMFGTSSKVDSRKSCYIDAPNSGIQFFTNEAYNKPPNIYAYDKGTGQSRLIMTLNPQFSNYTFGDVRLLKWSDESGHPWNAGLVLPVNYKPGKAYPLVVQTHGFDQHSYLINGFPGYTAPYAAQVLANREIAVLQFPNYDFKGIQEEHPILARGISSAVRKLVQSGIVDPDKVGLLGYSARGSLVFRMTVFPDFVPAAVLIADSFDPSVFGWADDFGAEGWGTLNNELLYCGALPWGDTQGEWINLDPFFHLDKISTPVLLKQYHSIQPAWWGIYAGLRRLKRPVDYVVLNDGKHPPMDIDVILVSRELTADWFDFWLNGREYNDPDKIEQYKIWRRLREEKIALPVNPLTVRPLSKSDCTNLDSLPKIR